jgi:hypothetical protein
MWWYFKKCCHIQNTGLKTLFRGAKKSLKKQEGRTRCKRYALISLFKEGNK